MTSFHTHERGGAHRLLDHVRRAVDNPRRQNLGEQRSLLEGVQVPPPQSEHPSAGLTLALDLAVDAGGGGGGTSASAAELQGVPGYCWGASGSAKNGGRM